MPRHCIAASCDSVDKKGCSLYKYPQDEAIRKKWIKAVIELGNIMMLSFIVILKCHDNQNRRDIFNIVISPTRYYCKYRDYQKIHCSEKFISVKYF